MRVDLDGNPMSNRVDEIVMSNGRVLSLEEGLESTPVVLLNWVSKDEGTEYQVELEDYQELLDLVKGLTLAAKDFGWLKKLEVVTQKEGSK